MTKEIIATTEIPREAGYIYFTGTDDNGNLTIGRTKVGRKKKEESEEEFEGEQ